MSSIKQAQHKKIDKIIKQAVSAQYMTCPRQYFIMCSISLDNHYVVSHKKCVSIIHVITELFSFLFEQERGKQLKSQIKKGSVFPH